EPVDTHPLRCGVHHQRQEVGSGLAEQLAELGGEVPLVEVRGYVRQRVISRVPPVELLELWLLDLETGEEPGEPPARQSDRFLYDGAIPFMLCIGWCVISECDVLPLL